MPAEDYSRLKLLFVDDDPHTRTLLRELLRGTCWTRAEIVHSAAAAFKRIKESPPDLVFTDWQMPEESGIDLIRAIHDRPGSPDPMLPVILLTASGDVEHVMAARNAGAAGYVVKPISIGRIIDRVTAEVTKQRPFIVSPTYRGLDWRRPGAADNDPLPPDAVVLPPDGFLLAKVRGDLEGMRVAMRCRLAAITTFRSVSPAPIAATLASQG